MNFTDLRKENLHKIITLDNIHYTLYQIYVGRQQTYDDADELERLDIEMLDFLHEQEQFYLKLLDFMRFGPKHYMG